jgi:broad specificity phosphatase PhoE
LTDPAAGWATPLIPPDLSGTLALVRHGQSTWVAQGRFQGQLDPPLSPLGEEQARRVAAWLGQPGGPPGLGLPEAPREIVHSPLIRVARTAQLIADEIGRSHGTPPGSLLRPDPGLMEVGVGAWSGLTAAEVDARWPAEHAALRRDALGNPPPGGESLAAAQARVAATVPTIMGGLAAGDDGARPWTIVVAHGGILRLLLFSLLDLPLDRFWAFPFELAAVSVVRVAGGRASLSAHNLAGHLAGIEPADEAGGGLRAL